MGEMTLSSQKSLAQPARPVLHSLDYTLPVSHSLDQMKEELRLVLQSLRRSSPETSQQTMLINPSLSMHREVLNNLHTHSLPSMKWTGG